MNKIRNLFSVAPSMVGCTDKYVVEGVRRSILLIFDYEKHNQGHEFQRIGDTMEECEKRLKPVFSLMDSLVDYGARPEAINSFKSLTLLASTPERNQQQAALDKYKVDDTYSEVLTVQEASTVGANGYWNA